MEPELEKFLVFHSRILRREWEPEQEASNRHDGERHTDVLPSFDSRGKLRLPAQPTCAVSTNPGTSLTWCHCADKLRFWCDAGLPPYRMRSGERNDPVLGNLGEGTLSVMSLHHIYPHHSLKKKFCKRSKHPKWCVNSLTDHLRMMRGINIIFFFFFIKTIYCHLTI